MTSLVDTNILVYRFDARDPIKQRRAREILRDGLLEDSVVLAHQCIVEFVAAVSRLREELARAPLLPPAEARLEAEKLVVEYPVLYPTREVVLTALRGTAMYAVCRGSMRTCGPTPRCTASRRSSPRTSRTAVTTAACAR